MKKRILIILSILIIFGLIMGLVYLLQKPRKPKTPAVVPEPEKPKLEEKPAEKLRVLSDEKVFIYWTASDLNKAFYLSSDGQIVQANENQDIFLTQQPIENLSFSQASPDGQKIAVGFKPNASLQFSIFDLTNANWHPLNLRLESTSWSPDSSQLAALQNTGESKNLITLDLSGKIQKKLAENLYLEDMILDWHSQEEILFHTKPSNLYEGAVWSYNLLNKTWKNIIPASKDTKGLIWSWNQSANLGFLLKNGRLSLTDVSGQSTMSFSASTLPQKCTADDKSVYCFIPQSLPSRFQLPDDFLQETVYLKDNLFKIDLGSMKGEIVFESSDEITIDAASPQLLGDKLLFINRYDRKLYSLTLTPTKP